MGFFHHICVHNVLDFLVHIFIDVNQSSAKVSDIYENDHLGLVVREISNTNYVKLIKTGKRAHVVTSKKCRYSGDQGFQGFESWVLPYKWMICCGYSQIDEPLSYHNGTQTEFWQGAKLSRFGKLRLQAVNQPWNIVPLGVWYEDNRGERAARRRWLETTRDQPLKSRVISSVCGHKTEHTEPKCMVSWLKLFNKLNKIKTVQWFWIKISWLNEIV